MTIRHSCLYLARTLTLATAAMLAFSSMAPAGGRVVSSAMLPVAGEIATLDGPILTLSGRVHVVSQVWPTDGDPLCGLNFNLAGLDATGDDGSTWVGTGAFQHPPSPCFPPSPSFPSADFSLLPIATTQLDAPAAVPFRLEFMLNFDADGRLRGEDSSAMPVIIGPDG